MKIEVIFFCLLLSLASCKGQDAQEQKEQDTQELQVIRDEQKLELYDKEYLEEHVDNNLNIYTMEKDSGIVIIKKFDIERFEKNRDGSRYKFVSNGIEVEQMVNAEFPSGKVKAYYEHRKYVGSPYTYFNRYDADGNLIQSTTSFYNMLTGIGRHYDASGHVIKEENYDTPYRFSFDDLIKKMKEEYNIDLLTDVAYCSTSRYIDTEYLHAPLYEVYNKLFGENWGYEEVYLIDGRTGKTLFITKIPSFQSGEDEDVSVVELYLRSLKEKEPLQKPVETKPSKPRKKI